MPTPEQNQQTIVEHIVNIDTTAENIAAVNSVASIVVQLVAVTDMLPDIAGTASLRNTLLSISKKLTEIQNVADAMPLLDAVRGMESDIRAALASRIEIASVVAHLDALRSLAAQLDLLIQIPQHAADAKASAEAAAVAATDLDTQRDKAETARLGAELAENEAKTAANNSVTASQDSAAAADEARKSAAAAAAVSGLPDAAKAKPGDPLIWNGTNFVVGTLAGTLTSTDGALAVADTVLNAIEIAQTTAENLDAKATQASTAAAEAKAIVDGVDDRVTQAQTNATTAKKVAETAGEAVTAFATRLSAAENETVLLGQAQNTHFENDDIHHSTVTLMEHINVAVEAALDIIRDNGTGTLQESRDSLQKIGWLLDALQNTVDGFLTGEGDTNRLAMLTAIEANRAAITGLTGDLLLKSDIVDDLDTTDPTRVLSASQGNALSGRISQAQRIADAAVTPWVKALDFIPAAWPDSVQWNGLLVRYTVDEGTITNPEWYINDRGVPVRLLLDATGIRLLDGTTVQTGLVSSLAASQAAQSTALAAQTAAETATSDAASARSMAASVDKKASQAQIDATSAKNDATKALAKIPGLATQYTPGLVKGSDSILVDAGGGLHAIGCVTADNGVFVGQWGFFRQNPLPRGYVALDGALYKDAGVKFPELITYLTGRANECITEADWQARSAAASGIGGVPYYVYNQTANTLRLPDTRGDSPYHGTTGTWQSDATRDITASIGFIGAYTSNVSTIITGAVVPKDPRTTVIGSGNAVSLYTSTFSSARVVPSDTTNHPRRVGLTMAVYAGTIGA